MNHTKYQRTLDFVQEIGTIMYVGGILSHIVIGIVLSEPDTSTVYNIYNYKEQSAYILILPGLALKVLTDVLLYLSFEEKPCWLKLKFIPVTFLTINAFIFLVPMMPELVGLAEEAVNSGTDLGEEFYIKEHKEQFIGQLNVIPLVLELVLGSFRPKLSCSFLSKKRTV